VNRWDTEFDRLLSLGAAGLRAAGITDPRGHLFACSAAKSTALLVKRTELTPGEITKLHDNCAKNAFKLVLEPGRPTTDMREAITASPGGARDETTTTDLTAPTDDRPFFFYTVPFSGFRGALSDSKKLATEQQGLLTLVLVLGASLAFALVALLLPALARRDIIGSRDRGARARAAMFFSGIGLGYILVEVSLVQHLAMFLGHPVYALAAVLTSLLLATGIGSYRTRNVALEDAAPYAAKRAQILAILLAALALSLGPITSHLVGLPLIARLGVALVIIAPPRSSDGRDGASRRAQRRVAIVGARRVVLVAERLLQRRRHGGRDVASDERRLLVAAARGSCRVCRGPRSSSPPCR